MADIIGEPVQSTGVFVSKLGTVQYLINGQPTTRDDYNALTLARIAAALEVVAQDILDGDEEEDTVPPPNEQGPPTPTNIFGT